MQKWIKINWELSASLCVWNLPRNSFQVVSPGIFMSGKVLLVLHTKQRHSYPGMMYCCQLLLENIKIWQKDFLWRKKKFKTWLDMTFRNFIFIWSCPSFEQSAQVLWKSRVCWDVVWDWTGVKLDVQQCYCNNCDSKIFLWTCPLS